MDTFVPLLVLVLCIVLASCTSVNGATNSTDYYTEPEEISDSIPVAIAILIILIILVVIFIIILLIVCVKLCMRGSRSKDIEDQTVMTTYRNDTREQSEVQTTPEDKHEPVERHTHTPARQETPQPHRPRSTVLLVSPSTGQRYNNLPPISKPGHVCQCRECEDLRHDSGTTTHR